MSARVIYTKAGFWLGVRRSLPLMAGLAPFGFVTGLITERHGLNFWDCALMNGLVYSGAAQLVALANWTHPAPILAACFAVLVVNLRFALMGPVLAPWLNSLRPFWRFANLAILVDHPFALSVTDMRRGGRDAALFTGLAVPLWFGWITSTLLGFVMAKRLDLPPGHPLFFGALAAFIALLVPLWRGRADVLPWLIAAGIAVAVARLVPHSSWYIPAGAICGCLAGALEGREHE